MNLEIRSSWSPDLDPPSEGRPADCEDYRLFIQVMIGEKGQPGGEVFGLTVCSPSQLVAGDGAFITTTLVLESFSWDRLGARLQKLLLSTSSCGSWNEVIHELRPYLSSNEHD